MHRTLLAMLLILPAVISAQTPAEQAAPPKSTSQAKQQWSEDGLQKVEVRGMDVVYMRPGASLAGYKRVSLGTISVSFRKGWERSARVGSSFPIRPKEAQQIRDRLISVLREELLKQLADGGYKLVDEVAEDVLAINASIIDLDVTAPDVMSTTGSRVYAVSAGEMTLIAELHDALTGDTIVRAYDHAKARETTTPHQIWRTENANEARRMAAAWAKVLREQLDAANAAMPAPAPTPAAQ